MKRVVTTAAGFAEALGALQKAMPEGLAKGLQEAGGALHESLVPRAINSSEPRKPVDQEKYRDGWTLTPTDDGAIVGNAEPHSVMVERGRGPGPVPYKAILAWVKRKGFVRRQTKARLKGQGQQRDDKGRYKGNQKAEIERAEATAALAIQRKIEQQGFAPRWVLRRAIEGLRSRLGGFLRRGLMGRTE